MTRLTREQLEKERNERAGCVVLRYSRMGVLVALYRSAEASCDPDEQPWLAVCEEHFSTLGCATRRLGEASLTCSREWCEPCWEDWNEV
jgi:hypothetical protein